MFDPTSVHVMFVLYKVVVGQVFILVRWSSRHHSTNYTYSSSSTGCSYQDKGAKPGDLQNSNVRFGNLGTLDLKVMSLTV